MSCILTSFPRWPSKSQGCKWRGPVLLLEKWVFLLKWCSQCMARHRGHRSRTRSLLFAGLQSMPWWYGCSEKDTDSKPACSSCHVLACLVDFFSLCFRLWQDRCTISPKVIPFPLYNKAAGTTLLPDDPMDTTCSQLVRLHPGEN